MNAERRGYEGNLPSAAPLANAYVPFQKENPPMYEARKGLIRGTMYPGLDLPFMGMVNKKEKNITPLTELQALGFAINELALYLDTHSEDKEAFELYRT
jgi:spore coat protein JB